MPFVAAVTQADWIAVLKSAGHTGEVNFWLPSGRPVSARYSGLPLLFVQKGREPRPIPGYGIIDRTELLSIQEAWDRWGTNNGVWSLAEFVARSARMARTTGTNSGGLADAAGGAQAAIRCIVLRDLSFLPPELIPHTTEVLPDFHPSIVSYKFFPGELPAPFQVMAETVAALDVAHVAWATLPQGEIDAVEARAVELCHASFAGWQVDDVSTATLAAKLLGDPHPGYDLRVADSETELHIEVKGSRQERPTIILTANELLAAAFDPQARLFVVGGIRLSDRDGDVVAEGGQPLLFRWSKPDVLRAVLDHYRLSESHGLTPVDAKWRLDVHNTDLLEVVPLPRA